MGPHSWEQRQAEIQAELLERETSLRGSNHTCLSPPPTGRKGQCLRQTEGRLFTPHPPPPPPGPRPRGPQG